METTQEKTIGEMVVDDHRTATVFKSFGIDFCCKGSRSLTEACESSNIRVDVLVEALNDLDDIPKGNGVDDPSSWPLDLLADYIEKRHHSYVEKTIVEITPFLDKVKKVHGDRHPELIEINDLFVGASGELAKHMKKEELLLFPFVRKLVQAEKEGTDLPDPHFGTVENPISMMKHEHEVEGERFGKIFELSNGYTPPEDACATYKVAFAMLKDFESDLHQHIHLENNILFPRTVTLEKQLKK